LKSTVPDLRKFKEIQH